MSLSPSRKPEGSDAGSVWLSSTRSVPPASPTGTGSSRRPCIDPQLVEHPQRRPGEEAELRVVPLALELGDHHDREHHLVLGEAAQRAGVGQQHAGVEDVGAGAGGLARGSWRRTGTLLAGPARAPAPRASPSGTHADGPGPSPKAGVRASGRAPATLLSLAS